MKGNPDASPPRPPAAGAGVGSWGRRTLRACVQELQVDVAAESGAGAIHHSGGRPRGHAKCFSTKTQ